MRQKILGKSLTKLLTGRKTKDFIWCGEWGGQDSSKNRRVGMESNFLPFSPIRYLQNSEATQARSLRAERLEEQRSAVAVLASGGNKTSSEP